MLKTIAGITAGPAIPNNGQASLFNIATEEPIVPDVVEQQFTIQFNQIIPKPFCGGPGAFLRVQGRRELRSVTVEGPRAPNAPAAASWMVVRC